MRALSLLLAVGLALLPSEWGQGGGLGPSLAATPFSIAHAAVIISLSLASFCVQLPSQLNRPRGMWAVSFAALGPSVNPSAALWAAPVHLGTAVAGALVGLVWTAGVSHLRPQVLGLAVIALLSGVMWSYRQTAGERGWAGDWIEGVPLALLAGGVLLAHFWSRRRVGWAYLGVAAVLGVSRGGLALSLHHLEPQVAIYPTRGVTLGVGVIPHWGAPFAALVGLAVFVTSTGLRPAPQGGCRPRVQGPSGGADHVLYAVHGRLVASAMLGAGGAWASPAGPAFWGGWGSNDTLCPRLQLCWQLGSRFINRDPRGRSPLRSRTS